MRMEVIPVRPINNNDDTPIWSSLGWSLISILKESSGEVVFGTQPALLPVNGGLGRQLPSQIPIHELVPPGTRIYLKADGPDERVSITVTPLDFLNDLSIILEMYAGGIKQSALQALRDKKRSQAMQPNGGR